MASLKMENVMVSFIILGVIIISVTTFYNGLDTEYNYQTEQDSTAQTINNLNLMTGFNNITNGLMRIQNPNSNYDIIGGLRATGIGFLKIATGIITFPIAIIGIYTGFFEMPAVVEGAIGAIVLIYIFFLILNKYLGES